MPFPSNQCQQVQPEEIPNVSITQRVSPLALWIYLLDPLAILTYKTYALVLPLLPLLPPPVFSSFVSFVRSFFPYLFPPLFRPESRCEQGTRVRVAAPQHVLRVRAV